jgi:HTH-type transcriptional regulator / antitoxin HipB
MEHSESCIEVMDEILKALRAARERMGISQREVGRVAGIPQGHISKIEAGAVDLRVSSLIELARSVDLEPMLVPRRLVPAVRYLISPPPHGDVPPMYSLDEK